MTTPLFLPETSLFPFWSEERTFSSPGPSRLLPFSTSFFPRYTRPSVCLPQRKFSPPCVFLRFHPDAQTTSLPVPELRRIGFVPRSHTSLILFPIITRCFSLVALLLPPFVFFLVPHYSHFWFMVVFFPGPNPPPILRQPFPPLNSTSFFGANPFPSGRVAFPTP